MSRRHFSDDPAQMNFLQVLTEQPEPAQAVSEATVIPEPGGPVVWLGARASGLLHVLDDVGDARQRIGFDKASSPGSVHLPEIQANYGSRLGSVRAGAADNESIFWQRAISTFEEATGATALVAAGLVSQAEMAAETRATFADFRQRYFEGMDALRNRARFRRILNGQLARHSSPPSERSA